MILDFVMFDVLKFFGFGPSLNLRRCQIFITPLYSILSIFSVCEDRFNYFAFGSGSFCLINYHNSGPDRCGAAYLLYARPFSD